MGGIFPTTAICPACVPFNIFPRVLLVEDEQAIRTLAERMLSDNGYLIFPAAGAEEALGFFDREDGCFDLVFSDVILPG